MGRIRVTPVEGPPSQDRPRQWKRSPLFEPGQPVTLLGYPVLAEGEDLTEEVPHVTIPWRTWEQTHEDYGLAADGRPLEAS
jgi:hypothetical protein